jgi:calcium-dependent protein kinase
MWSLGVVVFILLAGYMPFSGSEQNQVDHITSGRPTMKPKAWENISKAAREFVNSLLVVDPVERMTAQVALEHPFVAKRNEAEVTEDIADALVNFGQISHFRRACMNMMAWSLNNEERKTVRDCFLAMDKDRTGVITLSEFKQVVAEKFEFSDDQALAAFSALDSNHDEVINYSDFLAAMCSTRIAIHDDLLKKTFMRFDVDNSGYITASNLREVLGDKYGGDQIERLLEEADTSRDGKISEEEFFAYIKNGSIADPTTVEETQDVASFLIDDSLRRGEKDVNVKMRLKAI